MPSSRFNALIATAALLLSFGVEPFRGALAQDTLQSYDVSDTALIRMLTGFESGFAEVNGVRLHYVAGGDGDPVILLPGWPQTWWSYHKMMPRLAEGHRVIVVDIRGMGASEKPVDGYDKKTMAKDIFELVRQLGYERADIVGHDIGAQVAFAFAANHPEATRKLVLLDVAHPDEDLLKWPAADPRHLWRENRPKTCIRVVVRLSSGERLA